MCTCVYCPSFKHSIHISCGLIHTTHDYCLQLLGYQVPFRSELFLCNLFVSLQTVAKLLLPATPTKEENDLVYEATLYKQRDQTALRPDTLVDLKRLNTIIQTSDSSSVEPSPLEMDLTAPSLQDLCFFNSIM